MEKDTQTQEFLSQYLQPGQKAYTPPATSNPEADQRAYELLENIAMREQVELAKMTRHKFN